MADKEKGRITEEMAVEIEDREFSAEETKAQRRVFEQDFIKGLLAAADYRTEETKHLEIIRNQVLYFAFDIRGLSEEEYDRCKTKHTKYVRNKQLGIKLPEDTNTVKYRCALIYQATIEEDRKKLWDSKQIWEALTEKGFPIMNGLDVIETVLRSGEKDKIIDCIDQLSGYENSNLEEVAKKLILAGGRATLLHHIFQKTGMTLDEFYEKPAGVRAFLLASMLVALESKKEGEESDGGYGED